MEQCRCGRWTRRKNGICMHCVNAMKRKCDHPNATPINLDGEWYCNTCKINFWSKTRTDAMMNSHDEPYLPVLLEINALAEVLYKCNINGITRSFSLTHRNSRYSYAASLIQSSTGDVAITLIRTENVSMKKREWLLQYNKDGLQKKVERPVWEKVVL